MTKKLKSKSAFTLSELLVTVLIFTMMGVAVTIGMSAAAKAYAQVSSEGNASMLVSTIATKISDELRFAKDIAIEDDPIDSTKKIVSFTSQLYGANAKITISGDDRVLIGGQEILDEKFYANLTTKVDIKYDKDTGVFGVEISAQNASGNDVRKAEFSVANIEFAPPTTPPDPPDPPDPDEEP